MLGDFIYSEEVDSQYEKTGDDFASPRKFDKAVRRFLTLAVIFVCGGLIWIFCISPCMVPVRTDIKTFPGLEKADVLKIAGIENGAAYVTVNAETAETLLSNFYPVESARVIKRFPDRVSIYLEPRKAVAVMVAAVNGKLQPVYFDRYGVAFQTGGGVGEAAPSWLPVVSGIYDENQAIRLGMRLPLMYQPLFTRIGEIIDDNANIWQAVSEIGIARKNNDMYDLVLYPVHDSIKIRMGSDISKDSLRYALLMFDVCRQYGDMPDEIDVRSGIGVVKAKEASYDK